MSYKAPLNKPKEKSDIKLRQPSIFEQESVVDVVPKNENKGCSTTSCGYALKPIRSYGTPFTLGTSGVFSSVHTFMIASSKNALLPRRGRETSLATFPLQLPTLPLSNPEKR